MASTATAVNKSPDVQGDGHKHKKNALSDGQGRLAMILLAPSLLVILVVAGIPVLMSIRESFFRVNDQPDPTTGIITQGEQFVGLQNFTDVFGEVIPSSATGARWSGSGTRSGTRPCSPSSASSWRPSSASPWR